MVRNKLTYLLTYLLDYMYVWTYSIVHCLKYIIGFTDLLISCHVRNTNYA